MNCTEFLDRLDAGDSVSADAELRLHVLGCPECARLAVRMQSALMAYRLPDQVSSVDMVPRVMDLLPFLPAPRRVVSMRHWLLGGFLLFLSIAMLPLMGTYRSLSYQYGTGFSLPFILVMSGTLSLYVGLFALSHMDELATRFNLRSFSQ